jgi:anti-sigma factor RsiW
MTNRENHPLLEEMLDELRGELSPLRADQLREHRATCSQCASAIEWLEDILGLAAHGPLEEPPDEVLERAFDIVPAPEPAEGRRWSLAELIHDTFPGLALASVRGAIESERRVLYRTDSGDLDLEIVESPDKPGAWRVTGQLLAHGSSPTTTLVALLRSDAGAIARAASDDLGVFVFPAVASGRYRLEVLDPESEVAIQVDGLALEAL